MRSAMTYGLGIFSTRRAAKRDRQTVRKGAQRGAAYK